MASISPLQSIRKYLCDIIGEEASKRYSDDFLNSYIEQFQGRLDDVQCALESLIEQFYEIDNERINNLIPEELRPKEPIEFFQLPFVSRKKKVSSFYSILDEIM